MNIQPQTQRSNMAREWKEVSREVVNNLKDEAVRLDVTLTELLMLLVLTQMTANANTPAEG